MICTCASVHQALLPVLWWGFVWSGKGQEGGFAKKAKPRGAVQLQVRCCSQHSLAPCFSGGSTLGTAAGGSVGSGGESSAHRGMSFFYRITSKTLEEWRGIQQPWGGPTLLEPPASWNIFLELNSGFLELKTGQISFPPSLPEAFLSSVRKISSRNSMVGAIWSKAMRRDCSTHLRKCKKKKEKKVEPSVLCPISHQSQLPPVLT